MIIIIKPNLKKDSPELSRLNAYLDTVEGIERKDHRIQGKNREVWELYVLGETHRIETDHIQSFAAVQRVIRVSEKFRKIAQHGGQNEPFHFTYNGVDFSQDSLHLFAGLCAVDVPEHVEQTFAALQKHNLVTARMGAYKPRTSPYDFQGHGQECLTYVFELAGKYGIKVIAMEVTHERHIHEIEQALEATGHPTGVMVQIGTRNAQNFELLKAVGNAKFPVLYKRGMGITLEESLNACEYISNEGNPNIIFCLRGVKSHLGDPHRNLVDFAHVPVIKSLTRMPVCIDPSHSVGRRMVSSDGMLEQFHVSAQGVVVGANMILVDFHPNPTKALCDGPQALLMHELPHFIEDMNLVRETYLQRVALAKKYN